MPDNGRTLLGPGTTAALDTYGQSVAQHVAVARRYERGTIEAVTRLDNQRVTSAEVRVGSQTYTVPWNGAGARVGDVVEVSRGLGSAAAPDYRFERFVDSLVAYVYADDDASIPPPSWTGLVLTATMLINAAQQGAQVTLYILETAEAYGPAETEVRWRRSGVGANWRSMAVPNVGAVDAVLALILPELLEPEVSYDFQTRTRTISGSVSPYGTTLTQTILPGFTSPAQPAPFTLVPPGPSAIPYLDTSNNLELVIHYPPPSQPTTFDYWQTELALASGGPTSVTLKHYGSIGTYKVTTPTTYYIRYREASRYSSSGVAVVSPWMPGSGYSGPLVLGIAPERDVTPPNAPTDLGILFNGYVTQAGQTVQLVQTAWNGDNGSLNTYSYSADFDSFEIWMECTNQFLSSVPPQRTGRNALASFVNQMRPTYTYRMNVRAIDKIGNATAWTVGPSITVPASTVPTGTTTVVIERMGYNAAALRLTNTPTDLLQTPIAGFNLWSAPNGFGGSEVFRGFVPGTPNAGGASVSAFYVLNPVTSDPLPNPPNASGTQAMVGTQWAFRAVPVSTNGDLGSSSVYAVGAFTAVDGANLIVNSVHGNKITAGTITADKLNAAIALISQYIGLGAGAWLQTNAQEVVIDQTGIDVTGENLDFWAGPSPKTNWRGSVRGSTASGAPGAGNPGTGLTLRLYDGYLQAQSSVTSDAGWTLAPDGLKLYVSNWPAVAGYERYYSSAGIRDAAGTGLGAYKPIPPVAMTFGALGLNTDWLVAASYFSPAIPTSAGYTGFNVRGNVLAPAGTTFYVHPGVGYGITGGAVFTVPASGNLVWGPIIVGCVWGQAQFYIQCSGNMTSGGITMSGYFR